ncbi:hypothetical protein ALQ71_03702 [Pseudomonas coronafaciens pv. striafaciens]|nr:hypothetical protein ALQ71_03702 [Pseudomonas coronafaciens pv. striafaciens]
MGFATGRSLIVERIQTLKPMRCTQRLEIAAVLDCVRSEYVKTCEINQWCLHIRLSAADKIPAILRPTGRAGYMPLIGPQTIDSRLRWNLYG